ncbi:MAG: type II toxin-antitoxin system HipA family toxin [Spirochaetaceae bacterium]|nr:MAG: type II toxin-antitoxin system HipA family toxin [Spirochaetaceae bacterium]
MRCFFCNGELPPGSAPGTWHSRCSRGFFGTPELPHLEISNAALEELARQVVSGGRTVPGVQRKLPIHLSREGQNTRLTLAGYPAGYILKPPSPDYPHLPELEHLAMCMAEVVGVTTVPHGLITLSDRSVAYITRRVDRRRAKPSCVPMEDLCQLSLRLAEDKYRGSYEQIAKVIAGYSSRPGLDLSEYFLLLVFCFVVGNADMHLKNFSLYCPEDLWILAPAYDLVPTALVIPDDPDDTALPLNGKKHRLARRDFENFGVKVGLPEKAVIGLIDSVLARRDQLAAVIERAPVDVPPAQAWMKLIDERLGRLR